MRRSRTVKSTGGTPSTTTTTSSRRSPQKSDDALGLSAFGSWLLTCVFRTSPQPKAQGLKPSALTLLLVAISVCVPLVAHAQETIAEIRVHGNHTTPDADVIGLSGLNAGDEASQARLAEAEHALRTSNRFEDVEVRKRFRSIENPS